MSFPQLDVDFHLAPFVDERDHFGLAQARVRIGAPHFEKPREFWVRPVRWCESTSYANMLLRPVEAEEARLMLGTFAFRITIQNEALEIPESWKLKSQNKGEKLFSSLARFWNKPEKGIHIGWKAMEGPTLYLPDTESTYNQWQNIPFQTPNLLSTDEVADLLTTDFHYSIKEQLKNESSQLYLTWQWNLLTREQQWNRFLAGPIWKDYPALLKNILQSQALYTPEIARGGAYVRFRSGTSWMDINAGIRMMQVPEHARKWERILYEYFGAQETVSCVPAHVDFQSLNVLRVRCPAPTHHEMLEARLQLHEWAREYLTREAAQSLIDLDALN